MKIAIISDTHDNLKNLRTFFNFSKKEKIKILIHCGDVTNGETLKFIEENFNNKIFLSLGNADIVNSFFKINKKTKIFEKIGKIKIGKLKIGFCHQFDFKKTKEKIKNFNFFFFGHIHYPLLRKEKNCYFVNPGNLAGIYYKASFAVLNTDSKKIELKILEKIK